MERQLRMGGGIMGLEPRQQYGLGSFVKKAVKGVTGAVKSIAKSDLGKAALLAGGAYFAPTMFGQSAGFGNFGNLIKSGVGNLVSKVPGITMGDGFLKRNAGLIGSTVLGGVLGALSPQEQEEVSGGRNVEALRSKLTKAYTDLQYDPAEIPTLVANDLSEYTSGQGGYAEGGRIGYANGSEDMILPMRKPEIKEMIYSNPGAAESGNPISTDNPIANLIDKYNTYKKAMPGVADETKTYLIEDFKKSLEDSGISIEEFNMRLQEQNEMDEPVDMAYGGRMGYAFGTDPVEKAGIMGLPVRQNQQGVKEVDLRETGGFIPPVGVKEKADDIPAMLSNNEFVFTADSVRNMGDGDVNKGAEKMYAMMKHLENGGRV